MRDAYAYLLCVLGLEGHDKALQNMLQTCICLRLTGRGLRPDAHALTL